MREVSRLQPRFRPMTAIDRGPFRSTDTRMLDRELVLENSWLKERIRVLQAEVVRLHELAEERTLEEVRH